MREATTQAQVPQKTRVEGLQALIDETNSAMEREVKERDTLARDVKAAVSMVEQKCQMSTEQKVKMSRLRSEVGAV